MPDTCAECGKPLTWSPSEWWCSDDCQHAWTSRGTDTTVHVPKGEHRTIPPSTWATTAIPHPHGGLTYARSQEEFERYMEDTAPAEAPPEPERVWTPADGHPLPPVDQPWWRRLLGTTKGT